MSTPVRSSWDAPTSPDQKPTPVAKTTEKMEEVPKKEEVPIQKVVEKEEPTKNKKLDEALAAFAKKEELGNNFLNKM